MRIDPATGIDLDDPQNQAIIAQANQGAPDVGAGGLPAIGGGLIQHNPPAPVPEPSPVLAAAPPPAFPASPPVSLPPTAPPPALPLAKPAAHGARAPGGPSAEQRQIADVNAGELAAGAGLGEANAKKAEALAAGKANEVAVRQQQEADAQNLLNAKLAEKSKVDAQAAADAEAARKGGFRSYWADKDIGTKILAAISVGLSGIGQAFQAKAGRAPGENMALTAINAAIAQDWQLQKESIAKLEKQAQESGADAKHISAEVALMQASHAKNALDLAVAQTEQQAAAQGPDVARAASQGVLAQLRREQLEAGQKLDVTKAQVAEMRAGTTLKYAEAEHARAAAAAAGQPKENSRGITDARQRAMVASGLEDQDRVAKALEIKGVQLTEQDRQRIQDNRTYLKAAQDSHGGTGAAATVIARKYGLIPRNEFDGLSPEKKQLAGAYELMSQKAALLAAGSQTAEAINHARGLVDLMAPGLGPQETQRRRQYIRQDLVGANVGLVPGEVGKARAGAEAAREPTSAGPPPGAVRGTYKGMKGYMLGGKFYPDDNAGLAQGR